MRRIALFLLLLIGITLLPGFSWSQGFGKKDFGGEGGKGGGFKMPSPDESFNKLSGGKDVIIVSEMDESAKRRWQFISPMLGLTGDRISRDQFKAASEKLTAQFQSGGGMPKFGGMGGAPPMPGAGGGPPSFGGPPGTRPPLPPPGGGQDSTSSPSKDAPRDRDAEADARAERSFRERDKDNDGFLRFEELSETLQRERDTYDANKDGFVDLAEYKNYLKERFARKDGPPTDRPATTEDKKTPDGNTPVVPEMRDPYREDPRPQIFRVGKLPKELPEWFVRLDKLGDSDGQVGLYEWKVDNKPLEEFSGMDLNGDGLLTAEEYFRWKGAQSGKKSEGDQVATSEASQDRGNRSNSQSGDGSPRFGNNGNGGGQPRFGGMPNGFGPPPGGNNIGGGNGGNRFGNGGDNNGGNRFGGPKGGEGGNRFGNGGENNGGNRFGGPKGGDSSSGGNRFGGPKGGDNANGGTGGNPLGGMFRKR